MQIPAFPNAAAALDYLESHGIDIGSRRTIYSYLVKDGYYSFPTDKVLTDSVVQDDHILLCVESSSEKEEVGEKRWPYVLMGYPVTKNSSSGVKVSGSSDGANRATGTFMSYLHNPMISRLASMRQTQIFTFLLALAGLAFLAGALPEAADGHEHALFKQSETADFSTTNQVYLCKITSVDDQTDGNHFNSVYTHHTTALHSGSDPVMLTVFRALRYIHSGLDPPDAYSTYSVPIVKEDCQWPLTREAGLRCTR